VAIKAVIFDFCQTLVNSADGFRMAEKIAERKIFTNLALTDWDAFLAIYRKVRKDFYAKSCFSRKSAWQEVYWQHCREGDAALLGQWEADYWSDVEAETVIFPETMSVLTDLTKEYKLALITNTEGRTDSDDHPVKHFPDLQALLDVIVISGEEGVPAKPDPKAFAICLDRLGLGPAECVYVGDDWRRDIRGAIDAGLGAIWIKHGYVQRNWADIDPADIPVITSLDPLLELDALLSR
jgi:putative hydrolase of the HAD superfamily